MLVFLSLAQPAVLFPTLEEYRIFFVLAVLAGILFLFKERGDHAQIRLPQNKFIYGMLIAYTLSEVQYLWFTGVVDVFSFWLKKVLLYCLLIHVLETERDLKRMIWAVLVAVGILIGVGWDIYWYYPAIMDNPTRLQSVGNYNLSNSFALLLTLAFPLGFSLLETENAVIKKVLLAIFLAVAALSCVFTKSRGGTTGMLAGIVMSVLLSRRLITNKSVKIVICIVVVSLFVGFGVKFILARVDASSFFGTSEASSGDRMMAWVAAFKMFIDHPFFGIGWSKFAEYSLSYGMDKRLLAHNTFISVLAETGIVGFICFVGMVLLSFKELLRIRKSWANDAQKENLLMLANGILISFICFFINTSFSVKDHDPMFWTVLALIGIIGMIHKRDMLKSSSRKAEI